MIDGYELWLDYRPFNGSKIMNDEYTAYLSNVQVLGSTDVISSAASELRRALSSIFEKNISVKENIPEASLLLDHSLIVGRADIVTQVYSIEWDLSEGYVIGLRGSSKPSLFIVGLTDSDVLYAVFAFLRLLQTGCPFPKQDIRQSPKITWRMLNHWDNPDGSIERGYAGKSLWKWSELPSRVDPRYTDYARACASIGLNASVLNNVNADSYILSQTSLLKVEAIANVLRKYGISVFLSINFDSPMAVGELSSADPLDPEVVSWWKMKVAEIYSLIPDFGGFLVKADSEGQPGPFSYGRTHTDGANMLASVLKPHDGIVIWRAFVYGHGETDRAKKAYTQFKPHDGEFSSNAALQVKNGAIDFQPREPVHPLFGGMVKTSVFMEFQITQEYLGQGNHLVYLAPMWKEILDFDTHAHGKGTSVASLISKNCASPNISGIAAVANTGDDRNWCGHFFHAASWYAYGRLSWDPSLDTDAIAREWIACTWGGDLQITEAIMRIMKGSWEACIDYMTPLCLHHIMNEGHHYGPNPGDMTPTREDWRPSYYHRASRTGLGFDRTRTGSGAVDQYHDPVSNMFNDITLCPEKYLLWFHHVPWDTVLSSGRKLMDELSYRYRRGVLAVEKMLNEWENLNGKVDAYRYEKVLEKLKIQLADAYEWEEVCVSYFGSFSKTRNLLADYGYSEEIINSRIEAAWDAIFVDPETKFYFETTDDSSYIMDTGNLDVRTEGMSYGMMMAVQMGKKEIFDRLWKWSREKMYQSSGKYAGYFAWSCNLDGVHNSEGPAPDGEEYFAMALFFASRLWGDSTGIYNYSNEARNILRSCIHKGEKKDGSPMWEPSNYLIKFTPDSDFTDPSYHLPHFYDLFSQWSDPEDRSFWKEAAEASRKYLTICCHPVTGLSPEYATWDASPNFSNGHGNFFSDSYRVALNIGLDALWTGGRSTTDEIALKIISFFDTIDLSDFSSYGIDGTPLAEAALHPLGLIATNAAGAIAADSILEGKEVCVHAVQRLMEASPRKGNRRYYDNCLYFFSLLTLSGRFKVF